MINGWMSTWNYITVKEKKHEMVVFTIKKLYFSPDYAVHRNKATALTKLLKFIFDFYLSSTVF
jgi:hypothetical protein